MRRKNNKNFTDFLKSLRIVIVIIYLFSFQQIVCAQIKRALIIGLGKYEDRSWGKINGDRDVPLVTNMLKKARFNTIITLVNSQATKKKIISAFNSLACQSKESDIVYIHFSGHGQQMIDLNGDEEDGKDESWIPYDAYKKPCNKDHGEKHLSDDEICILLTKIKRKIGISGKLIVVVDACHSGTSTWSDNQEADIIRGTNEIFLTSTIYYTSNRPKYIWKNWVTISACKDNQNNYELRGKNIGKLSYALYELIKSNSSFTDKQFESLLKHYFKQTTTSHQQTPIISGIANESDISTVLK